MDLPPGADDWLRRITLPLSPAPRGAPTAWIADGWLVRAGASPEPLPMAGLIERGYEASAFVVLDTEPQGWLRIRYASGGADGGTAWTQACAGGDGPVALEFVAWSEWLLGTQISPLFFRSDARGPLRSGPSAEAPMLAPIADDYILEPLETRGEWMRVSVREPSDYCALDPAPSSREGWVRWSSPGRGPLLWYFTRGC